MKSKKYYVYILTNKRQTVFYVGVANSLERRIFEHKEKSIKTSFTSKYNVDRLIYFEEFNDPEAAIVAEKKIKGWTRDKKLELVKTFNPDFKDLFAL